MKEKNKMVRVNITIDAKTHEIAKKQAEKMFGYANFSLLIRHLINEADTEKNH